MCLKQQYWAFTDLSDQVGAFSVTLVRIIGGIVEFVVDPDQLPAAYQCPLAEMIRLQKGAHAAVGIHLLEECHGEALHVECVHGPWRTDCLKMHDCVRLLNRCRCLVAWPPYRT